MAIRVEELTKIYGKQKAVNGINFDIPKGSIVGFLGPNGAGKSTTMKMLTGYIPPTHGKAFINDIHVELDPIKAQSKIGYLPENNPLYVDMFVREYLLFMAELNKVKKPKIKVEEIIDKTGLRLEAKKKIDDLSKGYRQRVGLAQALIHDPEVLILDEPTSAMDPNQVVEIRNLIQNISQEKTILLSSHILQEVEAICQSVIIINLGKIVANAKTNEIMTMVKGETKIYVEFSSAIPQDTFSKLPEILRYEKGNKENAWYFYTDEATACKIAINKMASSFNTYILEQKEEKESLEHIFKKLTNHVDHI